MNMMTEPTRREMDRILEIEGICFNHPWTEGQLLSEMYSGDAIFLAYEENGGIAGYCNFHLAGDQAEMYKVAVHPDFRRRGIAEAMILAGFGWAEGKNCTSIFLEVRCSNSPAIALYEKLGFKPAGRRKNYYDCPREDGIIMEKGVTKNDNTLC